MEMTVANPLKCRLMTINVEFSEENTTWFDCYENDDIYSITDFDGSLIIKECNYNYPVIVGGSSREDINYDQQKAQDLKDLMLNDCI